MGNWELEGEVGAAVEGTYQSQLFRSRPEVTATSVSLCTTSRSKQQSSACSSRYHTMGGPLSHQLGLDRAKYGEEGKGDGSKAQRLQALASFMF